MRSQCTWFHVIWCNFEGGVAQTNVALGQMPEMSDSNCSLWKAQSESASHRDSVVHYLFHPSIHTIGLPPVVTVATNQMGTPPPAIDLNYLFAFSPGGQTS